MFFRNKVSYHAHLVNHLAVLRYRNVSRGVCYGLAAAGLQAVLLQDTESFDKRIHELYKIKPGKLPRHMQLDGFFDTIAIYQGPQDYPQLFPQNNEFRHQRPFTEIKLALPEKLEQEGGLSIAANFSGAYTIHELYTLFSSLRAQLKNNNADYPVGIVLANVDHAFTIGYDPSLDKWMLIEVDQGPIQRYNDFALAGKVNKLFSENKITVCNMKIYLTKKNEEHAINVINAWEKTSEYQSATKITAERIHYRDSNQTSLLYSAAQCGLTETVRELLALGSPTQKSGEKSPSPLHIASYYGYANVVEALLEYGADANNDTFLGRTAIAVAAHNHHMDVVKLLREYNTEPVKSQTISPS